MLYLDSNDWLRVGGFSRTADLQLRQYYAEFSRNTVWSQTLTILSAKMLRRLGGQFSIGQVARILDGAMV